MEDKEDKDAFAKCAISILGFFETWQWNLDGIFAALGSPKHIYKYGGAIFSYISIVTILN